MQMWIEVDYQGYTPLCKLHNSGLIQIFWKNNLVLTRYVSSNRTVMRFLKKQCLFIKPIYVYLTGLLGGTIDLKGVVEWNPSFNYNYYFFFLYHLLTAINIAMRTKQLVEVIENHSINTFIWKIIISFHYTRNSIMKCMPRLIILICISESC